MKADRKTVMRILPSFHYDVAYRKTFKAYLPRSFTAIDEGLKLLEKHEDFVFNIEQVILIREYWKKYPSKRGALKRFAAEKRLLFAPGMFTMPDSNIPSGENFIRNALIGRHWLKRHLDTSPECCWMADVFGHNPQSPQISRTCGFSSYMFERGKSGSWNTTFLWEGIDGTAMPAHWEIDTYFGINVALNKGRTLPYKRVKKFLKDEVIDMLRRHGPTEKQLFSAMGGDFNIPEENKIKAVRHLNRDFPDIKFIFSSLGAYFSALEDEGVKLDNEKIDLNPLFEGCNSSRIRLKLYNRKLEERAASIEMLETINGVSHRVSDKLWEDICWNAFHDIICGTLEHNAYCQALKKYQKTDEKSEKFLRQMLMAYACNSIEASDKGRVLFNSLPYPRKEVIEMQAPGRARSFIKVDIPASGLLFVGDSCGTESAKGSVKIKKRGYVLENNLLKVKLGTNGTVESFFDKEYGNELADSIKGMNCPVLRSDRGDLWVLDDKPINASLLRTASYKNSSPPVGGGIQREGRIAFRYSDADSSFENPSVAILDNHPLQCAVRITYKELRFQTRLTLRHDEKMLRFKSTYMPAGKRYRLGIVFPTSISRGRIRHSVPFGHVERPEGEYAVQGWIDYSDSVKGLLLLNKGLPGNNVTDNVMMLSIFRGVAMEDSDKNPWYEEGIEHVFEYGLMPFKPGDKEYNPARTASLFNREIECLETTQSLKPPKPVFNSSSVPFIQLSGSQAEISCIKRKRKSIIVRLWESSGKHGDITLVLKEKISTCFRTNAAMTYFKKLDLRDNNIRLRLKPFEIITLKITLE